MQMQQCMQWPKYHSTSTDKCVILSLNFFFVSNPSSIRNHWAAFEKYMAFQRKQGNINTFHELNNVYIDIDRCHMELVWAHHEWFTIYDQLKGKNL